MQASNPKAEQSPTPTVSLSPLHWCGLNQGATGTFCAIAWEWRRLWLWPEANLG